MSRLGEPVRNSRLTSETVDFKVGDVVCCEHAGYWVVEEIEAFKASKKYHKRNPAHYPYPGYEYRTLVHLSLLLYGTGRPPKNERLHTTSPDYCDKVTPETIVRWREKDNKKWTSVLERIEEVYGNPKRSEEDADGLDD